jgi:Domain of unknown function (DUF4337)
MGSHAEVEVPHDDNDPFVKRVAMSVAMFAVVLALAAAGGNNAGKDMMMYQLKASNEWNRYQAKSQREVLYMQEREELEQTFGPMKEEEAAELAKLYEAAQKNRSKLPAETSDRRKQRLGYVTTKLVEYKKEKDELSKQATEYQQSRDEAHKKDPFFDAAELLLQIGIVLASVAMLSKARWAFLAGCVLGVGGLALTVLGYFFPDVPVPFVSGGGEAPAAH